MQAASQSDSRPVVVVTGASSGIGRATAQALARDGAAIYPPNEGSGRRRPVRLVLAARAVQSLSDVRLTCLAEGSSAMSVVTDVSDAAAVDDLFEAAVARYGRVDAVVHSCAVIAYGRFEDVPTDVFDQVLATTLTGTANVARAAIQLFRAQGGGRLVIVGSLLGKVATPLMGSYVTAKWGVHGLARVLQIEARQTPGIDVSLVWPGSVDTPTYRQAANYMGRVARPPPPVDSPEKVARAILRAIEHPRREISVGIANPLILAGSRLLPGVFDALVEPLFRLAGQTRAEQAATAGNVFEPNPNLDALHGNWKRRSRERRRNEEGEAMGSELEGHGAEVQRMVRASAQDVWHVLSDGWSYASWVVGTARIRAVDAGWPKPGTRIHHSFGIWPGLIDDSTEVLSAEPGSELLLEARGWPAGEAHVRLTLTADGDDRTTVRIVEDAVSGPGRLVPGPVRHALISWRNTESLRRLALLAEDAVDPKRAAD